MGMESNNTLSEHAYIGLGTLALTSTRHLVRHTLKTLALLPVYSHMGQT